MADESEFLKNYSLSDYERPSVAADVALFRLRTERSDNYRQNSRSTLLLLLIKRGVHPFIDQWALPGGFLRPDETIEECALREIFEETSVRPSALMPAGVFSDPYRDPRGRIISNAFVSVIGNENEIGSAGDDASDARWFEVSFEGEGDIYSLRLISGDTVITTELEMTQSRFGIGSFRTVKSGGLAFDHAEIIAKALTVLRNSAENFEIIFDFLPETFTLTELQNVQETVMNISVLPANFRRKISVFVEETGELTEGAGHRPAKLYKRKKL